MDIFLYIYMTVVSSLLPVKRKSCRSCGLPEAGRGLPHPPHILWLRRFTVADGGPEPDTNSDFLLYISAASLQR